MLDATAVLMYDRDMNNGTCETPLAHGGQLAHYRVTVERSTTERATVDVYAPPNITGDESLVDLAVATADAGKAWHQPVTLVAAVQTSHRTLGVFSRRGAGA